MFNVFAYAEVLAIVIVDDAAGLTAIEAGGAGDEIGYIEGKETPTIETAWIPLRQHKGLGDSALGINITEIGPREEAVVATGTEDKPARVGAPVVERFGIFRVGLGHRMALSSSEVEQIEVGLVMPDAELPVVGKCIAKETSVIGGTGEGQRLMQGLGIDNGVYTVAETARGGVEVDTAEIIADGVELMISFWQGSGRTEIERTAISREDRECLIDRILLEKG